MRLRRYSGWMLPLFVPLIHYIWLPAASFLAGVLNTVAGGGSFLSLPALIASTSVIGVGAVTAQATNTVALWPGQLTSLVAFRGQLRTYGWNLVPLALVSGGGRLGGRLPVAQDRQPDVSRDAALAPAVCLAGFCAELSAGALAFHGCQKGAAMTIAFWWACSWSASTWGISAPAEASW